MKEHSITIQFMCKVCSHKFNEVATLIVHKIACHSEEFSNIKAIIFEENSYEFDLDLEDERVSPNGLTDDEDLKPFSESEDSPINTEESMAPLSIGQETREQMKTRLKKYVKDRHSNPTAITSEIRINAPLSNSQLNETEDDSTDGVNLFVVLSDHDYAQTIEDQPQVHSTVGENIDSFCTGVFDTNSLSTENSNVDSLSVSNSKNHQGENNKSIVAQTQALLSNDKYNPFVLLRRLTSKELQAFNRIRVAKRPTFSTTVIVQSDFDNEDAPKRTNKRKKSVKPPKKLPLFFVFPKPTKFDTKQCEETTLPEWLVNQSQNQTPGQGSPESSPANVILLDPDPTQETIEQITAQNPIVCKLCHKKLKSDPEVRIHVTHCWLQNKKLHRHCISCNKSWKTPAQLRSHNLTQHTSKAEQALARKFKCDLCPAAYFTKRVLYFHVETHKPLSEQRRPFVCEHCGKSFFTKTKLKFHSSSHERMRKKRVPREASRTVNHQNNFKCPLLNCTKSFSTASYLKFHLKIHANPKSSVNSYSFIFPEPDRNDKTPLIDWLKMQPQSSEENTKTNVILLDPDPMSTEVGPITPDNPITCKLCRQTFESEPEVKVHVKHCWQENKDRHRYCAKCEILFKGPCYLIDHCRRQKCGGNGIGPKFECQSCPKVFWDNARLLAHMEVHKKKEDQKRNFVCEICGFAARNKAQLFCHFAKHSDSRPFKCTHPNCFDSFKTRSALYIHTQSHSTTKPFKCTEPGCSREFKRKVEVLKHILIHRDDRPLRLIRCSQPNCDKVYTKPRSLKCHLKKVHNVGPDLPTFQCDMCGRSFESKQLLNRHLIGHTGEWPFKCTEEGCTAAFKEKCHFEDHLLKHRGEVPAHQCESCGKVFLRLMALKNHMRCHRTQLCFSQKTSSEQQK